MKRIPKDVEKFLGIQLFDTISRIYGLRLGEESSQEKLLETISKSFIENKTNPIVLHGFRIQAMFSYVVASLEKVQIIKQEDSGELFASNTSIQVPDYRIVVDPGNELFVEVKNCHKKNPNSRLAFSKKYIEELANYSQVFGLPIKIAIYWSRWNIWTLISPEKIPIVKGKPAISMPEAFKINEMASIGDMIIGTKSPLVLRLLIDPSKPRTIDKNGNAKFTVGGVELYSAGTKIDDDDERNLAFYLMLYGEWLSAEPQARMEDGEIASVDFAATPVEPNHKQGFDFVGSLSGMISRRYNELTISNGEIDRLSPSIEPEALGILTHRNYKGKFLPLWRMHHQPN